ncbi:MAG: cobalamin biosynthesis protein CbiM [Desulfobacterium sp.]|nr:cobalamin biosynthesis protein CbiM [Desulfobacterium sp.]
MHMADALISPVTGGAMWAVTAGLISYCSKKVKDDLDDIKVPLMGVMGAFIFAAQMINFTIPATGSSGHLGGGLILSIILGPYAAFLTIASVLTVQALFFADGGLLALGCNIFNLGFFPCFIAFPLIYKKIVGDTPTQGRIVAGSLIAGIVGLQLGALSVVLETLFSGISELPFTTFVLMMLPIHLAIGIVEGLATAAVVVFIFKARPEILRSASQATPIGNISVKTVIIGFLGLAVVTGGALSWFASSQPDGLEWSMAKTSGSEELKEPSNHIHEAFSGVQKKTAFLPDYGFKEPALENTGKKIGEEPLAVEGQESWPAVNAGTSVSGIVGGTLTLALAVMIGFVLKRKKY